MTSSDSGAKPLGDPSLTALVAASMIGAGVFTTSGFAIADLRDPRLVLAAWLTGGVIAICGAISYGRLVALLTESGGEYLFLSRFVHPSVGFVAGWVSLLAGFTGAGAYAASAFETYALPDSARPEWLPSGAVAILLVALATLAHAIHTRRGAAGQNAVMVLKLGLLGLFIAWSFLSVGRWEGGATLAPEGSPEPVTPLDFATSVMWISLSYSGFNAAVYVAGEARNGARGVARAMAMGTALVALLYLAINAIFVFGPPPSAIAGREDVAAIAAESIGGTTLATIVRLAICLGLASSVSSTLMAGPRVYAKMAADHVLPRFFDSDRSPPTRSVIAQGAAVAVVVSIATLRELLSYLGMTLAISAAATAAILLFITKGSPGPEEGSPGRVPAAIRSLAPPVYVGATLVFAALAAWNEPREGLAALATLVTGGVAFLVVDRRRAGGVGGG